MSKDWAFVGHAVTPRDEAGMTRPMVAKGLARPPYTRPRVDDLPLTIGLLVMGYLIGSLPDGRHRGAA